MNKATKAKPVRFQIILSKPPPGVQFAVQRGRLDLLQPSACDHEAVQFVLSLRVDGPSPDGSVKFFGEFAQGPSSDRFIYINSGTLAGQAASNWTRRAKLKLAAIPRQIVDAALAEPGAIVEALVTGTMADGGPICASVKPHDVVWSFRQDEA